MLITGQEGKENLKIDLAVVDDAVKESGNRLHLQAKLQKAESPTLP